MSLRALDGPHAKKSRALSAAEIGRREFAHRRSWLRGDRSSEAATYDSLEGEALGIRLNKRPALKARQEPA